MFFSKSRVNEERRNDGHFVTRECHIWGKKKEGRLRLGDFESAHIRQETSTTIQPWDCIFFFIAFNFVYYTLLMPSRFSIYISFYNETFTHE